jgi:hypothetical protein
VLAKRASVATVQGTEWLHAGTFETRERQYDELQGCGAWGPECVERWSLTHEIPYTHVYIPKTLAFPCCEPLLAALEHDAAYRLVFANPAAAIFERQELVVEKRPGRPSTKNPGTHRTASRGSIDPFPREPLATRDDQALRSTHPLNSGLLSSSVVTGKLTSVP